MKILFPVEVFFPSQAGGPANSVYWLTKHLKKYEFDPVIVATDKGLRANEPRNKWVENAAGRVIHVRTHNLSVPIYQTLTSISQVPRSDFVHLSSVFFPSAFFTGIAARLFGKKIVLSTRGEVDPYALMYSRTRKRPFVWAIRKFLARKATFHSTCDEETEYIKDLFGEDARVFQIPNFIEIPDPVERVAKHYFLFVGRLHRKKGIENLLQALASNPDFLEGRYKMKFAGKGTPEYERSLRRLVSDLKLGDKVEFVGQVEGDAKQKLYADAFWTIMPSHTENFGLVVLESLAQGTPVIASTGSPWGVLEREHLGFWVDNSPESLSAAISSTLQMAAGQYEEYRQRARPFVERDYSIEKNINKWLELYASLG